MPKANTKFKITMQANEAGAATEKLLTEECGWTAERIRKANGIIRYIHSLDYEPGGKFKWTHLCESINDVHTLFHMVLQFMQHGDNFEKWEGFNP